MHPPPFWTLTLTVILVSVPADCDIFSSTSHLQNLMYLERHLVTSLYEYVEEMEGKIAQVRRSVSSCFIRRLS
jgi:hypothetical protein